MNGPKVHCSVRIFASAFVAAIVLLPASAFVAWLVVFSSFVSSGVAAHRLTVVWARLVSRILGISVSVDGAEKLSPGTSYVITPNHQSNLDVLPLISVIPIPFRWVLKKELLDLPLFGWSLSRIGAISVDRSNPMRAIRNLLRATEKVQDGWSILIFPEGTISDGGELLPFKKGPFLFAVKTGLPILPVTCNGVFGILPKGGRTLRRGHVTVTISDPIATNGMKGSDIPGLMEKVRAEIARNIDPDYDPFDVQPRRTETIARPSS